MDEIDIDININEKNKYDYYQCLYLNQYESDQIKIRQNYKQLVKQFHPDKNNKNTNIFNIIQNSYEILSNPALKLIYDSLGKEGIDSIISNQNKINKINSILQSENNNPNNKKLIDNYKKLIISDIRKNIQLPPPYSIININHSFLTNNTSFIISKIINKNYCVGLSIDSYKKKIINKNLFFKFFYFNKYFSINGSFNIHSLKNYSFNSVIPIPNSNFIFSNSFGYKDRHFKIFTNQLGYKYKKNHSFYFDFNTKNIGFQGNFSNYKENLNSEYNNNIKKLKDYRQFNYHITLNYLKVNFNFALNLIKKYCFHNIELSFDKENNINIINEVISKVYSKIGISSNIIIKNKVSHNIISLTYYHNEYFSINLPIYSISKRKYFILFLLIPICYKFFLSKTYKKKLYNIYNEISKNNQLSYNEKYISQFNERNNSNNEFKITYAIIGESSVIKKIVKYNYDFKKYKNVFDIKIPLTNNIILDKLKIPQNIFEIEGIYMPDYKNKNNISYYIKYLYKDKIYITFKNNMENEFILPY